MKNALNIVLLLLLLLSSCAPAFCQQQLNAATKEDVEQLLTLLGTRQQIQQLWSTMAQQAATRAAERYQSTHPNATPLQIRKMAEASGQYMQSSFQALSVDELIDAIVPIYQEHFTHADIITIIEFYNSPTGQKFVKEGPAMMSESMQAVQPIISKHEPEIQAAAQKAIEDMAKTEKSSSDSDSGK
jgi:uncharacterized protein